MSRTMEEQQRRNYEAIADLSKWLTDNSGRNVTRVLGLRKESMMLKRLLTSKTAWTAVGGILVAVGMGLNGQLPWNEAGTIIFAGLMGLFIRDGVAKGR